MVLPNPIGTVGRIYTGGTANKVDTNSSALKSRLNPNTIMSFIGIKESSLLAFIASISWV